MQWHLLMLSSVLAQALCANNPTVEAPAGTFIGHILQTRYGRDIYGFQGIPYAKPPLGKLRFKDGVRLERLDKAYEAQDDSRECVQPVFDFTKMNILPELAGSEDCLYLNVYTPKGFLSGALPVFVWIHGGGYFMASGSSHYNGPEYLLDKDVVFVTINYRLGVLGFLSTGDKVIPGNLGMKDQALALRWVQENIAAFGGDPQQVTIGGESAGGNAVIQHLHSPLSRGLFQRGIAQSGSMDCLWGTKTSEDARIITQKFAAEIHCSLDGQDFVACLQDKTVDELFTAAYSIKDPMGVLSMEFVPVIEDESPKAFLTEASILEDSDIPLIIGVTSYESLGMPSFLTSLNPKYAALDGIKEDQDKLFPVILYYFSHPQHSDITKELVQFYFGQQGITNTSYEQLINLVGDMMFNHAVNVRARKHKGTCYLYKFSYKGEIVTAPFIPKGLEGGVGHSEDLLYLFNFAFIPHGPLNQQDRSMSDQLVNIWYNFIKTGDPTPDTKLWKESAKGTKYLDFTNEGLLMRANMFPHRMEFLNNLDVETRQVFRHDEL